MSQVLGQSIQLLASGLRPYVRQRLIITYGPNWQREPSVRAATGTRGYEEWDAHVVLLLMWEHWNAAFRSELTFVERSLVSELREVRNRWAHQYAFPLQDVYRCVDSVERLLGAIHSDKVEKVTHLRLDCLKSLHDAELASRGQESRDWFTAVIVTACWLLTIGVMWAYLPTQVAVWLVVLSTVVLGRVVARSMKKRLLFNTGPRQCFSCTRIYYGHQCPYCNPNLRGSEKDRNAQTLEAADLPQAI